MLLLSCYIFVPKTERIAFSKQLFETGYFIYENLYSLHFIIFMSGNSVAARQA